MNFSSHQRKDLDPERDQQDQHDRGENEQYDGDNDFDRCFIGQFFCQREPLVSKHIPLNTQELPDADPQFFRLNDGVDHTGQIRLPHPVGKIPQGIRPFSPQLD